jgi:hypothetical protein
MYQCPKCQSEFERGGRKFDHHVTVCSGVALPKRREYTYSCFICGKKFFSKVLTAKHMAVAHEYIIENPEKMCFECKEEVEDPLIHAKIHSCPFICSQCPLRFISQEKLDNHEKNLHGDTERPFTCDTCNSRFKTMNHLRSHQKSVHTSNEEKKHVCEICNRRYVHLRQLNSHKRVAHTDVRKFPCNYCDVRFKKLDIMKDHCIRVHGETNYYPCSECPEKYKTLNELKNHQSLLHGVSINVQKYHEM